MKLSSFLGWELMVFALLSGADFGLTYLLVGRAGAGAYESNPLAGWWLKSFGWAGLAAFKAGMVGLAAGLALVIWVRRPRAANLVLKFGCGAAGVVVVYSCYLACGAEGPPDLDAGERAAYIDGERRLVEQKRLNQDHMCVLGTLSVELAAGRCTLGEAADRLACTELAADAAWWRGLRAYYPELDDRGALAASAVRFTLRAHECCADDPLARRLARELFDLCGKEISLDLPRSELDIADSATTTPAVTVPSPPAAM